MNKKTIAIIPARGGSKRIPRKNLLPLGGKPLFLHSVDTALSCSEITEVLVSTDDPEIKRLSLEQNVRVIDRPMELAHDAATTLSAIVHAVEIIADPEIDKVVVLQPTNPLRPGGLIELGLSKMEETGSDSLFTVSRSFHKLGKINSHKFKPFNYVFGQRSQDLEPLFFENGLLYITSLDLLKKKILISENAFPLVVEHRFSNVDIDEPEDFEYAEFLYQRMNK